MKAILTDFALESLFNANVLNKRGINERTDTIKKFTFNSKRFVI